jgi:putative ABC transport system permease protein
MFKNYLKIAVRNLIRHKTYSFINIAGLAVGMASCFLILLYVLDEASYDRYHEKADQIFRVLKINKDGGEFSARTSFSLAPTLKNDFPEIINTARIFTNSVMVVNGGKSFKEDFFFADQDIFNVFTIPLIYGDNKTALEDPYSIVISEEMAKKYFKELNPIGKILSIRIKENEYNLKITGILEKFPHNSHFRSDFIASMSIVLNFYEKLEKKINFPITENWGSNIVFTYLLLPEGHAASELEKILPDFIERHIDKWLNINYHLQPLTQIHLHSSRIQDDIAKHGNIIYLYLFSVIAFLILLIACINFIILSTAQSVTRAKEVGIRKVIGASRLDVIKQILGESVLVSFISLPIAILLVELLLPFMNQLLGTKLIVSYYENWQFIIFLIFITFFVGIFSGTYISFYISAFQPIEIFKNKLKTGAKKTSFRKTLIITQLSISIILIVCTITIYQQLHYIKNKELGFNKNYIIVINSPKSIYNQFKNEILKNPNIINISGTQYVPPEKIFSSWHGKNYISVDYKYFETLGIEIAAGRAFSMNFSTDAKESIILNETGVKEFELKSPLGKEVEIEGKRKIIGIVKDFHFRSLHEKIEPLYFIINPEKCSKIIIRNQPENTLNTISYLKEKWGQFAISEPFEYYFIDEKYDNLYKSEQRLGEIIGYFGFFALFVTCLGLFGLISFMAERRTKEIAVRKALGASVTNVVKLLIKEFIILVVIASIIAWPAAYYAMNKWLQNFAYHVNMGFGTFLLAGLVALIIAIATVSFQAVKAAMANPVKFLRYE